MLTQSVIDAFAALAGDDLSWPVKGSSRPGADVRTRLRDDILARQGGICAQCGGDLSPEVAEFCHIVARGPKVKGFLPGNIFAGHPSCNASTKPVYDESGALIRGIEALPITLLARPDVVPMEWTPFPVLRAMGKR